MGPMPTANAIPPGIYAEPRRQKGRGSACTKDRARPRAPRERIRRRIHLGYQVPSRQNLVYSRGDNNNLESCTSSS